MTLWDLKQNIAADWEHRVLKSGIDIDSKIAIKVPLQLSPCILKNITAISVGN